MPGFGAEPATPGPRTDRSGSQACPPLASGRGRWSTAASGPGFPRSSGRIHATRGCNPSLDSKSRQSIRSRYGPARSPLGSVGCGREQLIILLSDFVRYPWTRDKLRVGFAEAPVASRRMCVGSKVRRHGHDGTPLVGLAGVSRGITLRTCRKACRSLFAPFHCSNPIPCWSILRSRALAFTIPTTSFG